MDDGTILWANRISQSVRLCRPVKIEYVKGTTAHILKEKEAMDEEIARLTTFLAPAGDGMVKITYSLHMTLIDGKVLNVITGTSSMQACPICKAKPSQFNDLSNVEREIFNPDPGSLKFGISPLHAWIRLLECCLHIAYRVPLQVWRVTQQTHKKILADRKSQIQRDLKAKLGLNVDQPKPGGSGTTNDGNTARTAFKNIKVFAEITELNFELLKRFQTILIALSCQLPLDPILFGDYCRCTAELYVHLYSWYPMPSTLYKILMHGKDILLKCVLPVGMLGEEASEAQNKYYRKFRLEHARKTSREDNLKDIFFRVLDASDPVISNIGMEDRMAKRKRLPIPQEVQDLFLTFDVPQPLQRTSDYDEAPDTTGFQETLLCLEKIELTDEINEVELD